MPTTPAATVRTVTITDSTVIPGALVVAASTKVVWHNHGHNRHTVTADDGSFGSAPLVTGGRFTINAPARPGVYGYHCIFHSYIRGTLTVSPMSLATPGPRWALGPTAGPEGRGDTLICSQTSPRMEVGIGRAGCARAAARHE